MTKKYSTKKALIASLLAFVLCFSMLVGSTFAWFTDTVNSDVNAIVAGNLDPIFPVDGVKRGKKVVNFKMKRRKGDRRKVGHRQSLTVATVKAIA